MKIGKSFFSLLIALPLLIPNVVTGDVGSFDVVAPNGAARQISRFTIHDDGNNVSITKRASLPLPFAPAGVAMDIERQRLFATSAGKDAPMVASITLSDGGDQMKLIKTSQLEFPAGYTSVDRSGKYFLTANYPAGVIAVYLIDAAGAITKTVCSRRTPNREAHCILTTPDNRFVYVPCVKNNNALYQYAFDDKTGELSKLDPLDASPPAMFGPRHVAYHPAQSIAYFSNEQQLGVSVYQIDQNGQLRGKQHATTMSRRSPYVKGERGMHASDLVVTPDGQLLFVAVRDFVGDEDSVFAFRIEDDGRLSKISRTPVGDIPWKLALSPTADLLLVSESEDRRLSVYRIKATGQLSLACSVDWDASVRDMAVTANPMIEIPR